MTGLDPAQLAAFSAVVDEGSFEAAARRLHVTPSAVSQRIKSLESRLGQVVVRRTRPVEPTEAGRVLLRLATQTQLIEHEALAALRGGVGGSREPLDRASWRCPCWTVVRPASQPSRRANAAGTSGEQDSAAPGRSSSGVSPPPPMRRG